MIFLFRFLVVIFFTSFTCYTVNQVCASCEFIDEPEVHELVVSLQESHCPVWTVTDNTWAAIFGVVSDLVSTWSDRPTNCTSSSVICTPTETSFPPLILRPPQVHHAHKNKLLRFHHACWCQAHAGSAIAARFERSYGKDGCQTPSPVHVIK